MTYKSMALSQQEKTRRITLECNHQSKRLGRPLYSDEEQDIQEKMEWVFKAESQRQSVIAKKMIINVNETIPTFNWSEKHYR